MAKIVAPNKNYNGISYNVKFSNGVGETDDPQAIEWFKEKGYKVVKDKKSKESIVVDDADEVNEDNHDELDDDSLDDEESDEETDEEESDKPKKKKKSSKR